MRVRLVLAALVLGLGVASFVRAEAPAPQASPSPFKLRGIKGLWWEGLEKYQKALPWVAEHGENFLMLCYTSFPASGKDWRAEYSEAELAGIGELAREAEANGVELCLSFNPGLWSKPPLVYSDEKDFQIALNKVKAVHARGVRSFSLCLDDIAKALQPADQEKYGNLGRAQTEFANRLWREMRAMDPKVRLIFCPSAYWTGEAREHADYMAEIRKMDAGIQMFWTGVEVCSPTITAADAREYAAMIGRKPIVWDNYPVNDMFPWRPLMGPVRGRAADLAGEVEGFMSNPMKQWEASRVPLATVAEYLRDPARYAPETALARAIEREYPQAQREAVERLVGLYGGKTFWGAKDWPPQPRTMEREQAAELAPAYRALAETKWEEAGLQALWEDVKPTVTADLRDVVRKSVDRRTASPLVAYGDDFEGGGGPRFGFEKMGRTVNYAYARPTGLNRMETKFWAGAAGPGIVVIVGRGDAVSREVKARITVNGEAVFEGAWPFGNEFGEKSFEVRALKAGENILAIENLEAEGPAGMPPWVMVSEARVEPAK